MCIVFQEHVSRQRRGSGRVVRRGADVRGRPARGGLPRASAPTAARPARAARPAQQRTAARQGTLPHILGHLMSQ